MSTIGQNVAALRNARGWTLRELSERTGVSLSHLSAIENHTRPNPSFETVARVARAFGVPLDTLADAPTAEVLLILASLQEQYDVPTLEFMASETAGPYVQFAKSLAESGSTDASDLLQHLAAFMTEQKQRYGNKPTH